MIAWLSALAAAGTDCPSTVADLAATLDEARQGLEAGDTPRATTADDRATTQLACLSEPLGRHAAAELHRTRGLVAAASGSVGAPALFAAARAIEPAFALPEALAPEGSAARAAYEAIDVVGAGFEGVAPPADGQLVFDGQARTYRPTDWPTVVQHVRADGTVAFTAWLDPGTPLPPYDVASAPPPAPPPTTALAPVPSPEPVAPGAGAGPRVPLVVAAIGSAALTATTLTMSAVAAERFADPDTPDADLDRLQGQANALVFVSCFTGAATTGFTIGAAVTHPRSAR